MHPYQKQFEVFKTALETAFETIAFVPVNEDISHLTTRLKANLQKDINFLTYQLGLHGVADEIAMIEESKPLTRMFGRDLTSPAPSRDVEAKEFQDKVEELYSKFLLIENDQLLDKFNEIEIRGVAVKAGLSYVTEKSPKRITAEFIEKIRQALRDQRETA